MKRDLYKKSAYLIGLSILFAPNFIANSYAKTINMNSGQYELVEANKEYQFEESALKLRPSINWNEERNFYNGSKAKWTLDGPNLNQIIFWTGSVSIEDSVSVIEEVIQLTAEEDASEEAVEDEAVEDDVSLENVAASVKKALGSEPEDPKSQRPAILIADIPILTMRWLYDSQYQRNWNIEEMKLDKLGGKQAVKFTFTSISLIDQVKRRGEAIAALVNDKFYMILYQAPENYYFSANYADYKAIVASVKFGKIKKKKEDE
ncbi:hypothetical protein LPB140_08345 [Sphingorhabdus lutea]|uniref:Uncharacterized protein n=1 Tax=Sphingorhabdus lutea TaxID=1913578 RepID=A0A1L3JCD1_9SPHN|nr:hypothetical protein [Sphingorhabdus lutea]APG62795.1 hypothetical protein LPB140_08345 [Sphingorhabdus lutea]